MLAGYERAVPIVLTLSLRAVKVLISKFDLIKMTLTLWQGRIVYCCCYLLDHSSTLFVVMEVGIPKEEEAELMSSLLMIQPNWSNSSYWVFKH